MQRPKEQCWENERLSSNACVQETHDMKQAKWHPQTDQIISRQIFILVDKIELLIMCSHSFFGLVFLGGGLVFVVDLLYFILFLQCWDRTQDLAHARQMLHHWAPPPALQPPFLMCREQTNLNNKTSDFPTLTSPSRCTTTLWGKWYRPHFTGGETEVPDVHDSLKVMWLKCTWTLTPSSRKGGCLCLVLL